MEQDKIRGWVRKKLDEGSSEERLKTVLEKHDHDPSIIDEVRNEKEIEETRLEGKSNSVSFREKTINKIKYWGAGAEAKSFSLNAEKGFENNWRILVVVIVTAFFVGAGSLVVDNRNLQSVKFSEPVNESEQNQNENEEITGNTTTIVFNRRVAEPSRAEITESGNAKFVSNLSFDVEISFETDKINLTLPSRESETVEFESLTYYTARPLDTDASPIYGSVNIE